MYVFLSFRRKPESSYFKYLKILWTPVSTGVTTFYEIIKIDGVVKSLLERHPGESRGPEHLEITGFRLSPE
jgi:hypothetical protein